MPAADLGHLDWSTLLLIAGGLVLGELLDAIGVLGWFAGVAGGVDPALTLVVVIVGAALLSALMSNTATATLLIPLALPLLPAPSTAVLVAVACSLGAPFVISTPQNALVAGMGVTGRDFLRVGVPVLVVGVVVVAASGPAVLAAFGLGAP